MSLLLVFSLLATERPLAQEVTIFGNDGLPLGKLAVESVFLDRLDVAFAPDGAAAVCLRHGRRGGSSLYILAKGRPARLILDTGKDQTLSDPIWSPDGSHLAVVVRGPARRNAQELALRLGGKIWLCHRGGDCRPAAAADNLWRPLGFEGEDALLAARVLPGDLVALAPVRVLLSDGSTEELSEPPAGFSLYPPAPLDWPRPRQSPPPDQVLAMPYIHQVYDTPNEFNGHWACGPTSTLMAIQHFDRLAAWPVTVDVPTPHTSDFGAYVSRVYSAFGSTFDRYQNDASGNPAAGAYGWCTDAGAAWAWRMQDYAKRHQLSSDFDGSSTFSEVQAALDAGKVVVLSTGLTTAGHIVTVKGYTADGHLVCNDPYGDKNRGYMNYYGEGAIYTWVQVDSPWFITVYGSGPVENDDAEFVSETVPDGTVMRPGENFTKSWTLKNTGNTTWTRAGNYLLAFDGEERFSAAEQTLLPDGASVAPGQSWTWEVAMMAPDQPGTWRGYWIMDRFGVHRFGDRVWVEIVVEAPQQEEPAPEDGGDGFSEDHQPDGGEDAQDSSPPDDDGGMEDSGSDGQSVQDETTVKGGCGCASANGSGGFAISVFFLAGRRARRREKSWTAGSDRNILKQKRNAL